MFILHGGQVTGPFDQAKVAASVAGRSLPADAMLGPTPQGPWSSAYAATVPAQAAPTQAAPMAGVARAIAVGIRVLTALFLALLILAGAKALLVQPKTETSRQYAPPPSQPSPTAPAADGPAEIIATKKMLVEAIVVAKPHMRDTENDVDVGTALLAGWAISGMRWADVSAIQPETSVAKVMKDSDLERGKRICASGTIAEIVAEKVAGSRLYNGALMLETGVIRFVAVGDTGALVANSTARFCGIVTGRFTYSNAIGGTTHAVRLVGMFDLPENKKAKAEPVIVVAPPGAAAPAAAPKPSPLDACCNDLAAQASTATPPQSDHYRNAGAFCRAGRDDPARTKAGIPGMLRGASVPMSCL